MFAHCLSILKISLWCDFAILLAALPYNKCHICAQYVLPALAQHQFWNILILSQ
jgi:hypothetical protein